MAVFTGISKNTLSSRHEIRVDFHFLPLFQHPARHGAKFDITTGKCVSRAKIFFIKMKTKYEPRYEVRVEGNSIKIGL